MLFLASIKQGLVKYIHAMMKIFLSLWTYVFLNKTTKSMNHLGGMGLEWWFLVEWLHKAHGYGYLVYLTCGKPPRNKGILVAKC